MYHEFVHFGKVTPLLDGQIPKMQMSVFLEDAYFPAKITRTNYKVDPPLVKDMSILAPSGTPCDGNSKKPFVY